jgi:hypothetical protein
VSEQYYLQYTIKEKEKIFFFVKLFLNTLILFDDDRNGYIRRSENAIKLRQVTFDSVSVNRILLKPSFCSGLKKSNNLSRNLNKIKYYRIIIYKKKTKNFTVHKDLLVFDLLV